MSGFFGHYAAYVLPAWGLSALALGWMTLDTLLRARRWRGLAEARDETDDEGR